MDTSDLPAALLKELLQTRMDELDRQIVAVLKAEGGSGDLDVILIGLYRAFKIVQTRRFVQNKLYRMSKRNLVRPVDGVRAGYALPDGPSCAQCGDGKLRFQCVGTDDRVPCPWCGEPAMPNMLMRRGIAMHKEWVAPAAGERSEEAGYLHHGDDGVVGSR